MKNKKTILAVLAGLAALILIFAWLFWGSAVPKPTEKNNMTDLSAKATVHNTVLSRNENGKKLWELKVEEATQVNDNLIEVKKLDGLVYLNNGDAMHVAAPAGSVKLKTNDFALSGGVVARLKNGGFLQADKVEWQQKEDILTATGAVKVIKDDMLARAEQVITSSKLVHFKLKDKAHVERGGQYEEQ